MLNKLRLKLGKYLLSDYVRDLEEREKYIPNKVNQKVVEEMNKINVLDYVLKDNFRTFSKEYERPEDKLNPQGQLSMKMWGYTQSKDPNFEYLMAWIMDMHSNEMLRHGAVTPERILYGRAQLSVSELIKKEVTRLSNLYEDILKKRNPEDFDENISVE